MDLAIVAVLFLGLGVAAFGWWLLLLIDLLQIPESDWEAAGQNKIVWLLVMVLLGFLGAIIYATLCRPGLNEVRDRRGPAGPR